MKTVKVLNDIVDYIYRIIFILIMLIGLYYIYDTAYIFYNASGSRLFATKNKNKEQIILELTDDYIAWLTIDDTPIDYPIMQGETNSSYLNKDPYGRFSLSGSIFLDSRNASDFSDDYSLVYGHHMANNLMFGALDEFFDRSYYDKHTTGSITLKDGKVYKLDIFACILTDANVEVVFNPQGSAALLNHFGYSSFYKRPKNNHIVALSTCMEPGSTKRTVLLACLEQGNN